MTIIAGSRIAENQHIWIGLTNIYGVGKTRALAICKNSGINPETMVSKLKKEEIEKIREAITSSGWDLGTALKRVVKQSIDDKKLIRSYQGRRHAVKLPVRGQNTQKNAKTARRRRDN